MAPLLPVATCEEARTLVMRNFPFEWIKDQESQGYLPSRIAKLLARFGELSQEPQILASASGVLVATATFATALMAQSAVQTMHGLDMRSETEKRSGKPPDESQRFVIQLAPAEARVVMPQPVSEDKHASQQRRRREAEALAAETIERQRQQALQHQDEKMRYWDSQAHNSREQESHYQGSWQSSRQDSWQWGHWQGEVAYQQQNREWTQSESHQQQATWQEGNRIGQQRQDEEAKREEDANSESGESCNWSPSACEEDACKDRELSLADLNAWHATERQEFERRKNEQQTQYGAQHETKKRKMYDEGSARQEESSSREAERIAAEKREIEASRREAERIAGEKRETERREIEAARREAERIAGEKREKERLEAEAARREAERVAEEKRDAERREAERQRVAKEEAALREAERIEAEKRNKERLEFEAREEAVRKENEKNVADEKRREEASLRQAELRAALTQRMAQHSTVASTLGGKGPPDKTSSAPNEADDMEPLSDMSDQDNAGPEADGDDTEADGDDTEESEYDPFEGGTETADASAPDPPEEEYNPFEEAENKEQAEAMSDKTSQAKFAATWQSFDDLADDGEDDASSLNDLMDLLRTAEKSQASSSTAPVQPTAQPVRAKGVETSSAASMGGVFLPRGSASQGVSEDETKPKRAKTEYVFNARSQRWEPKAQPQSAPQSAPQSSSRNQPFVTSGRVPPVQPNRSQSDAQRDRVCPDFALQGFCANGSRCRFVHQDIRRTTPANANAGSRMGSAGASSAQQPMRVEKKRQLIVSECEAEANSDKSKGFCDFSQALAVRLTLRFESNPQDLFSSMAEVGLPSNKDKRSTVKGLMRLCHPDKCKHPEAKRAMQILQPLLSKVS